MAYYDNDTVYQTQAQALNDWYTVDRLKTLADMGYIVPQFRDQI